MRIVQSVLLKTLPTVGDNVMSLLHILGFRSTDRWWLRFVENISPCTETTHENRPERRALLALSVHLKKVVEGREDSCRGSFKILSILYSWEPWRQLHYEPARPPQHLICIFTGPRRRSRHATIVLAVEKADDKMSYYWPLPLRWKRSVRGREDVSASLPMVVIYGGRSIVVWFSRTPPS